MDIFESLENLPVSEACFEDIVGLVEKYINENEYDSLTPDSHTISKHGKPEYDDTGKPTNKSAELISKAKVTQEKPKLPGGYFEKLKREVPFNDHVDYNDKGKQMLDIGRGQVKHGKKLKGLEGAKYLAKGYRNRERGLGALVQGKGLDWDEIGTLASAELDAKCKHKKFDRMCHDKK